MRASALASVPSTAFSAPGPERTKRYRVARGGGWDGIEGFLPLLFSRPKILLIGEASATKEGGNNGLDKMDCREKGRKKERSIIFWSRVGLGEGRKRRRG